MIETIIGDLLEAKEKFICHQANCTSHYAAGIAAAIFHKFPYSNIYTPRMQPDIPGTIIIRGNGTTERYVINLMGQYHPGAFDDNSEKDTEKDRQKYFHHALMRLAKVPNLESVAFPYKISCGLAGGDWKWTYGTLENFAKYIYDNQKAKVVIYQREEDK